MWYLSGTIIFFCYWLVFFLKDKTTSNSHLASWVVLIIAAAIWPLSAPLAMIELINKAKQKQDKSEVKIIKGKEVTNTVNSN